MVYLNHISYKIVSKEAFILVKQLEKDLRDKIIKVLWILVWGCIALDVSFFVVFYFMDGLEISVAKYVFKYLCLPFAVNMLTFLIARYFNKSEKYADDFKNMACSMALCTIGGSMGIFHSYYTPLWCVPCMALLLCNVFHNKKIHKVLLIYSCALVIIATTYISLERPSQASFYIQHCIVVLGITILSNLVANEVQNYQQKVEDLIRTSTANEETYRKRLERDLLTGVHSREYMQEIVAQTFGIEGSVNPVGIAILDLDDFKGINDKYGHDNGDKVLRTLGKLLNECETDEVSIGRFGGEEFVVIFSGGLQNDYSKKIDELRVRFSECTFDFMDEKVTLSAGVVKCTSQVSYEKAFNLADKALYNSKSAGKNRVTVENI